MRTVRVNAGFDTSLAVGVSCLCHTHRLFLLVSLSAVTAMQPAKLEQ